MNKVRFILSAFVIAAMILSSCGNYESNEVIIGNQVWMIENLNVDKFRNGDVIPEAKTNEEWETACNKKQPAWCYYENNRANGLKYGKLYNWYAVDDPRGLAPSGWHIPSDAEWTVLEKHLGDSSGKKIKSKIGWNSEVKVISKACPKCIYWNFEYRSKVPCHSCKDTRRITQTITHGNGSNSSGFSGLPGGSRIFDGAFERIGHDGIWWSSTENNQGSSWVRGLHYNYNNISRGDPDKTNGFSVRCIRD